MGIHEPATGKSVTVSVELKQTTSRCPVCLAAVPGRVVASQGRVFLERTCPTHGEASVCISSGNRFYHVSTGHADCCSGEPCCGPDPFDTLSTCLALIEIVDSCNLACPTCYADSPTSKAVDAISFEDFQQRVAGVIARKGKIEILQLSGGEPTLHPEFFRLLTWAQEHPKIDYVLLNTNGVRLASDPAFAHELDGMYRRGGLQLYLQYDGPQEAEQRELRGADLRKIRRQAIEAAGAMAGGGLPVTLAMTVTPGNLGYLWESVKCGLQYPHIRGVAFQPMTYSGRQTVSVAPDGGKSRRLNTADVILGLITQSRGALKEADFTPLPCGDPNCATIGYLIKHPDGLRSVSDFMDFSQLQGFLADRVNYNLNDLAECGCESEPLGALLKQFELDESHTFRLFIKPFMDAWTWDEDRIDRCCTHVIRPDGQLDSFCRYYSGFPGTWNGPKVGCAAGSGCCG